MANAEASNLLKVVNLPTFGKCGCLCVLACAGCACERVCEYVSGYVGVWSCGSVGVGGGGGGRGGAGGRALHSSPLHPHPLTLNRKL